ncbi:hypothetical protein [Gordonia neofelifaecis]|uniref:hypothetical protein n=1 Tax=Gordonia neofelifaecis TaxID=945692 RepID=UPI0002F2F225|nr:hypothetical protein [Gordonia neofelifaecis]
MKCGSTITSAAIALVLAVSVAACGSDHPSSPSRNASAGFSAITPSPAGTSTVVITSVPLTTGQPPNANEVNPDDYAVAGSPGRFRWSYASNPLRECTLEPAASGLPQRVTCSAPYPADAPIIRADTFEGPPNAVVLTDEGTEPTILEGTPTAAEPLPSDSRITVGDLSCTVPHTDSISCRSPGAWFTVENGILTTA